ncbi:MAG: hypothetical protein ABF636_13160 [Acetobacter sp.]|uniref:hypothetical protein n=1 Tax=Acetobacter sp. TaxID=440 RepID=UPI0039EC4B9A
MNFGFPNCQPDVWNFWFILKTFGPSCIAGSIALMALFVALTQRKIAANKYNLDLFDKRYEIYEKLNSFYDSQINHSVVLNYNFSYHSISKELKYILLRSSFLFENISKRKLPELDQLIGKIDKEFKSLLEEKLPVERYINERKHAVATIKQNYPAEIASDAYSAKKNEVGNHEFQIRKKMPELENVENKIKENHEKLTSALYRIIINMENELSVPHKPY